MRIGTENGRRYIYSVSCWLITFYAAGLMKTSLVCENMLSVEAETKCAREEGLPNCFQHHTTRGSWGNILLEDTTSKNTETGIGLLLILTRRLVPLAGRRRQTKHLAPRVKTPYLS